MLFFGLHATFEFVLCRKRLLFFFTLNCSSSYSLLALDVNSLQCCGAKHRWRAGCDFLQQKQSNRLSLWWCIFLISSSEKPTRVLREFYWMPEIVVNRVEKGWERISGQWAGLQQLTSIVCRYFLFISSSCDGICSAMYGARIFLYLCHRCSLLPVLHLNFADHQNHVTANKLLIVNNFYCNQRASASSAAVKVNLVRHCSLP